MHDNVTWSSLVLHGGSPTETTCTAYWIHARPVASSVSWLRGNNLSYDKPMTMVIDGKLNGHIIEWSHMISSADQYVESHDPNQPVPQTSALFVLPVLPPT